jgi:hypothetical protein
VLLLLVALREFRSRPRGDEEPQMPKWMATIDKTTPAAAVGLAALLSGANPKNLLLAGLKDWMSAHNAVIMSVLCLVISAKLIGDGISGLAS